MKSSWEDVYQEGEIKLRMWEIDWFIDHFLTSTFSKILFCVQQTCILYFLGNKNWKKEEMIYMLQSACKKKYPSDL